MRSAVVVFILSFLALSSGAEILQDVMSPVQDFEDLVLHKIKNWFKTPEEHATYLQNITKYPVSYLKNGIRLIY